MIDKEEFKKNVDYINDLVENIKERASSQNEAHYEEFTKIPKIRRYFYHNGLEAEYIKSIYCYLEFLGLYRSDNYINLGD